MKLGRSVPTSWVFLLFLLIGSATSTQAAAGRIGVRVVGGVGEFYDTVTGEEFVPRGANYARWGALPSSCNPVAPEHWVTFAVGAYDACAAERALTRMEASWVSWYEIEAYGSGYPADSDQDGVCDGEDLCPGSNDALDADADGLPDACDTDPSIADADGDGIGDPCDLCADVDDRYWGTTPPMLACPPYVFARDQGSPGEIVTFSVTATDPCDPTPDVACVPPSGSFFPRGTTMVTCTATDSSGNQATSQFPVYVQGKLVLPALLPLPPR